MAYVNIAEWNPDQIADWLKGLEDVIEPYIHSFVSERIDGKKLLHITPSDLIKLDIHSIGHQEIILQAVTLLKNLHYHLHQENAQLLALRLSSKSRSIYNELCVIDSSDVTIEDAQKDSTDKSPKSEKASTRTLLGVTDVLSCVKALVGWLNKSPFNNLNEYEELKSRFVELGIGLATIAQRDAFADKQTTIIRDTCFQLAQMADQIIQESKDPMILQPACLDVATIKKRTEDTFGISLFSSYHGIHQISFLRALSPAHNSGKLMAGDQIMQVNYQTVVGWTSMKVTHLMQENPCEVILTIKKSPRHANILSNIYFKPFRLPSKKRTYSPWSTNGFASNRFDLQSIPNLQFEKSFDGKSAVQRAVSTEPHNQSISPPPSNATTGSAQSLEVSDSDAQMETRSSTESDLSDDAFLSESELAGAPSSLSVRLFSARPRPPAHRRATIPGASIRPAVYYDQIMRECCSKLQATLPTSASVGFKPILIHATESIDGRVDSATPSSEEMPFIDELDEKDQSSPSIGSFGKGFIDRADIPQASSLDQEEPPVYRVSPGSIGRYGDSRHRLDKTVSSPVYDDYNANNRSFFTSCETKVTSIDFVKPLENVIDTNNGNHIIRTIPTDSTDEVVAVVLTAEPASPAFSEVTYVNQIPTADRGDSPVAHFQRRLKRGNRRISCRDLGQGDQQGWLFRRKEHKGFLLPHRWVKRWFILNRSILYGYKDRDSLKADSLIYLPGFHVSPAPEVKAKRFAFKIFHSRGGATFYFACESGEERSRWMSQMGLSAISSTTSRSPPQLLSDEAYYSDTDDELDDKHFLRSSSSSRSSNYSSPHSPKVGGNPSSMKVSSPLSYFSSSKSQPMKFLQSSKAELSNPVPTSNFRSYVRVRDAPSLVQPTSSPSSPKVALSKHKVKDGSVTLGKEVRRKNSIRERLMQLPNLTMDRRKSSQKQSPEIAVSNPKRICTASKSETNLVQRLDESTSAIVPHAVMPVLESRPVVTPVSSDVSSRSEMQQLSSDALVTDAAESCQKLQIVANSEKPEISAALASSHFVTPQDAIGMKLKCASQYFPVTIGKDQKEPMQASFQMDLSQAEKCSESPTPPKKAPRSSMSKECDSPKIRPKVPPRTKFLSPNERKMTVEEENSPVTRISRSNQPPNLVISPVSDDADSPKTPFKPTMGIAMIGKQRKTPTSISPKEILPHYPGMEYPPTFEAESYSLSSQRGIYSQETPLRPPKTSPQIDSPSDDYINISQSIDDCGAFRHQIYVTSPFTTKECSPQGEAGSRVVSPQNSLHGNGDPLQHSSFPVQTATSVQSSFPRRLVPAHDSHRNDASPQSSFNRPDISPPTSFIRREVLPQNSFNRQMSPQNSFNRQMSPQSSFKPQEVSPQTIYNRDVSPQTSYKRDISSRTSYKQDISPQTSYNRDVSPQNSYNRDVSPQISYNRECSPQTSFTREISPQTSFKSQEISPQGSFNAQNLQQSLYNRQVLSRSSLPPISQQGSYNQREQSYNSVSQQYISHSKQFTEKIVVGHPKTNIVSCDPTKKMGYLDQSYQRSKNS